MTHDTNQYNDLAKWEKSADPADRLKNNYYCLQRLACIHEYEEKMKAPENTPDDEHEAKETLLHQLDNLHGMYITDLEILIEKQLSLIDIFLPWRIKISQAV